MRGRDGVTSVGVSLPKEHPHSPVRVETFALCSRTEKKKRWSVELKHTLLFTDPRISQSSSLRGKETKEVDSLVYRSSSRLGGPVKNS